MGKATTVKISFVIPHKDDPLLSRLFDSLERQTCKDFEIIVVDSSENSSHLRMSNKWSGFPSLKVIYAKCGRGTARNVGAKAADADLLVFVDADVVLPKHFTTELIKLFEGNSNIIAVGFPIYPTKQKRIPNLVYRCLRLLDEFSYRYKKPRIPTTCAAYRRFIFNSRRFLDIIGEDVLFSADILKYGEAIFAKHIKVFEEPRRWDSFTKILRSLWHYIPSYVVNILIIFGLHNVLLPSQKIA